MNINYKIETIQLFFKDIRIFYKSRGEEQGDDFETFNIFENLFTSAFEGHKTQILKFYLECIYEFLEKFEDEIFNNSLSLISKDYVIKYNNSERIAIRIGKIIHSATPQELNILLGHFLIILNSFRDEDERVKEAIVNYAENSKEEEKNDDEFNPDGHMNHVGLMKRLGSFANNLGSKIKTSDNNNQAPQNFMEIAIKELFNNDSENNLGKLFKEILDPQKGIKMDTLDMNHLARGMMSALGNMQKK